ncbi:MAG: zinc ribbon domain-containing protein [Candidatus Pacearchaeota archaeon]|nr:zinc ribbon domain-containing protein [Candidatus Pacearchaeota archaeon]
MFFKKKNKCKRCDSKISNEFSFCPYCGFSLLDKEKELRDFGFLGKNDAIDNEMDLFFKNFSLTDKMINSIINKMMKNLTKELKNFENQDSKNLSEAEIKQLPNGIKISIGMPLQNIKKINDEKTIKKQTQKIISQEQIEKLSKLPRAEAKTKIRRLSNKIIYELDTPGISSINDVFVSKLESGYEIKAIGSKKIYVNSIPITLPLKDISIENDKLFIEFKSQ